MRPLHLQMQGFTCYREKQQIDFTPLTLFAIAGPTGAGKSSILDAIAFALYGKVPRLGGQNLDQFISLGAARASVLFEFDMRGDRYRVVRSMPRSGPKKAQLEQVSEGTQRALADGVDAVSDKLKSLLGLDYNAFIQSVLLPQGEFARFLKSTSGEQQKILRELLRLGVYERMRDRAAAQARELAAQIKTDCSLLEGPYAGATREHLAALQKGLSELDVQKDAAVKEHADLSRCLQVIRKQWDLVRERQERRTTLQMLLDRQPAIETSKKAVERAKQAALVVPLLDQVNSKCDACSKLEREAQVLARNLGAATTSAQQATDKLQSANERAKTLPEKRQRVTQLAAIQPVLQERATLASRQADARSELFKSEEAINKEKIRLQQETKAAAKCAVKTEELNQQRKGLGYDTAIYELFKAANRTAYDLGQERRRLAEELNSPEPQRHVQVAEAALENAEQEFNAAHAKEAAQQKTLRDAQTEYEAAQMQNRAATLRDHLTLGCTCPVCEQTVTAVPAARIPADLERTKAAVSSTTKNCEAAVKKAAAARDHVSRAQADAENARKNAKQWEQQAAACEAKIERFTAQLAEKIKPFACPAGEPIDQFVEREFERFGQLHGTWQNLGEELNHAELKRQKTEFARDATEQRLETEQSNYVRLSSEIEDAERRLAGYDSQIQFVSSNAPDEELKSLENEIAEIETQQEIAREAHDRAHAKTHDAELKAGEARTRLESLSSERDESQTIANRALLEAGFSDALAARKGALDLTAVAKLERDIDAFQRDFNQTTARIQELDGQLQGITLTQEDVTHETGKCDAAQALVRSLERQIGEQRNALTHLEDATVKADLLRFEHATRVSRYALMQQLSNDLRGDCFQEYLLKGSFKQLVEGASTRLQALNERYELTMIDSKFAVLDHDHGSQHRLADTLSGGETFLVSLALALELSEQIQQAAGAVRLDSLFIDEGFGTLDPETLDTVAEAIESLSKTNRIVGVITHVAELHRRLPRLEVRPGPSGSVVEYVED